MKAYIRYQDDLDRPFVLIVDGETYGRYPTPHDAEEAKANLENLFRKLKHVCTNCGTTVPMEHAHAP